MFARRNIKGKIDEINTNLARFYMNNLIRTYLIAEKAAQQPSKHLIESAEKLN